MDDKTIWSHVSFVISSEYRKKILEQLKDNPKTPSILAKKNNWVLSSTSRVLLELVEKELVQVLTPDVKHNRFYALTKLGKQILALMKDVDN